MSYFPSLPNGTLLDVFRQWPELADSFHGYMQQVMRGPSPLTEGQRELIAAFVSRLNGCDYCTLSHSKTAVGKNNLLNFVLPFLSREFCSPA